MPLKNGEHLPLKFKNGKYFLEFKRNRTGKMYGKFLENYIERELIGFTKIRNYTYR